MALVSKVVCELAVSSPGQAGRKALVVEFTLDAAYPAKGYALAAATLGLTAIEAILAGGANITDTADSVVAFSWDKAAGKLVFAEAGADGAALDDATAGSITTGSKVTALVIGY